MATKRQREISTLLRPFLPPKGTDGAWDQEQGKDITPTMVEIIQAVIAHSDNTLLVAQYTEKQPQTVKNVLNMARRRVGLTTTTELVVWYISVMVAIKSNGTKTIQDITE